MKLYVYCVGEQFDPPGWQVTGIAGAGIDILNLEGFSLLVSEIEGDTPPPATRENALTHDAVVRSVLDQTTSLPLRFGTVVSEEQLRSYLAARKESLLMRLAQVDGCVEMSVKIIWNGDPEETGPEPAVEGPGARFLKEKQREILGGERRAAQAREVATWLDDAVRGTARQAQVSLSPTEKLIVAAAYLVPRGQLSTYRERVGKARKMRPELHFLLSGPWPPYSFSNIDLEFKTRFGVS